MLIVRERRVQAARLVVEAASYVVEARPGRVLRGRWLLLGLLGLLLVVGLALLLVLILVLVVVLVRGLVLGRDGLLVLRLLVGVLLL
ncbi:hypothetical protein, partial [Streptomyces kasugaensis]|uniref:hypothetical protein n=1 Tax=Streptomyces kasugaensis TaxID=1946 RepID=UPI001A93FE7E